MNTEPMRRGPDPRRWCREAIASFRQHLAAGVNEAQYNVACDEHACHHYGETASSIFRLRLVCGGFVAGFMRSMRRSEGQA
ncbi:hypothetical protein [Kosakonia sp. MH5]|uniref:hypothetical protein n=1 Tax=Kosakonia sp. MH5 TaxID=2202822 RepID=UPI001374EC9C|nr:hypothetical protein [Kosakonia sp. MH5]NCF08734.1 hypothetical protein [Kosakonia sp. MH5]